MEARLRPPVLFATLALSAIHLQAQSPGIPPQKELNQRITALDAELFDAYNRCDLRKFASFFAGDVELYHDKDGVVLGKKKLTHNINQYVCGGDVRRDLVPGTLQIHRLEGFGALATGSHRFSHPKSHDPSRERKFINLWQYKNGTWKITRAVSFEE